MDGLSNEDDLIARYFAPLAGPGGLGLRDDAALVRVPEGHELVLTKDALVAGVHFFADDPWCAVAQKALRVNLSDLAAKGAQPLGYLLAIALPPNTTAPQLAQFAEGLKLDGDAFGLPLLGGDTVRTPGPLTISVTALGSVPMGQMVLRTGVQPDDRLYVTGTIGDSALGLQSRLHPEHAVWSRIGARHLTHLQQRYLLPQPRNGLASVLGQFAHGGMDVSDGLIGDLTKMLKASGVTAQVELGAIPLSDAARAAIIAEPRLFETAVTGGDDYELLIAVPSAQAAAFESAVQALDGVVTQIGVAEAGTGAPLFLSSHGEAVSFARQSFSHI